MGQERVFLTPPPEPDAATWWTLYSSALEAAGLSSTARTVIAADCEYIVERGVLAAAAGRVVGGARRGIVMGSVQSGKTASMLGVSALSLDRGVDAVVVLAGTRLSLWRQTFERLRRQLDIAETELARDRRRLLVPNPGHVLGDDVEVPLSRLYAWNRQQVRRAIDKERPLLAVVMKNVHHLRALSESLHRQVYSAVEDIGRPYHVLILDDEADDGSILDARVESGMDAALGDLKQVPRAIVDLWEARARPGAPAVPNLHVTYIGYTATPQANFLQSDHNPLAPRDFAIALRTPFDRGTITPRATTYNELRGLSAYYTGGEAFYRRGEAANLCIPVRPQEEDERLGDAVRAFLVAGAVRLLRNDERMSPSTARAERFESRELAASQSPQPHSMLLHPSAGVEDQFDAAAAVLRWAGSQTQALTDNGDQLDEGSLPAQTLTASLLRDEQPWATWLERYRKSAEVLRSAFDLPGQRPIADWADVRKALIEEIIPSTRLAVVNSDPRADERPMFEPWHDGEHWRAPRDLCTIFVSGNVMSRGLTLEGLTTTLFLRHTDDPYADTQMQMQRWFGFRGEYLELCRVFAPPRQLELFRAYHEADEALRREVIRLMNEQPDEAPGPQVLQGQDFLATGKLTNIRNAPLCPGAAPFVRIMNDGTREDPNAQLLAHTLEDHESRDVAVNGVLRGRMLVEPMALKDAASLLDDLSYDAYKPGNQGWQASRWRAVEAHIGLADDASALSPLYRPPVPVEGELASEPRVDCPYALGAYLRLWAACVTRHARGLVPTDDPRVPWSMVDLGRKREQQPEFYVGVRYGSGTPIEHGCLAHLPFPIAPMKRHVIGDNLVATWGSRNPGTGPGRYFGDAFFDYHLRGVQPPEPDPAAPSWRAVGQPGLILFHVVERDAGNPTVAVGLSIPLGGPDQFAARSSA